METYKFIQDLEKDFADCCGDIFLDNDEYVYDGDIFEKDGETFHLIQMRVYRILELLNEGDRSETYFNDIKIKIWNEILENVKNLHANARQQDYWPWQIPDSPYRR